MPEKTAEPSLHRFGFLFPSLQKIKAAVLAAGPVAHDRPPWLPVVLQRRFPRWRCDCYATFVAMIE